MSPSSYFMAADVVQDNIILVAYANSGAQAAVVINRDVVMQFWLFVFAFAQTPNFASISANVICISYS